MSRALIPNSTQVPDVILDHWMAELSGAELKVLLYIARRTYGFGKESDTISLTQIAGGLRRRDGTVLDRGTGASRSSVARSLKALEERGLIVRKTNLSDRTGEFEENTYSINLAWEPPSGTGPGGLPPVSGAGGDGEGRGVVSKPDYPRSGTEAVRSQNETRGGLKNGLGWSQNETYKKQIQETAQETAAACEPSAASEPDAADASLVEELVSHGVGRIAAVRLAREKPAVCRRCLEYLPFAKFRTTKGAWLANAIRDEYGPPEGYAKAREARERKAAAPRRAAALEKRPVDAKDKPGSTKMERVGALYARLEKSNGEALRRFNEHLGGARLRAERVAAHLSPTRREAHLRTFDEPARRLELFGEWLEREGRGFLREEAGGTGDAGALPRR